MSFTTNSRSLVSVGVASYNNAQYILETLNSIANQTYKNIELIIVDDCSSDNSISIIEHWMDNNPQIRTRLIANDQNEGISKTFAKLIKNSNGDYITTVGSDDNFLPFKIEKFIQIFKNLPAEYGVVFSDAYLIKPDGTRRYGRFIQRHWQFEDVPSGNIYNELLKGNFIPAMATMFKRQAIFEIGGIDETLAYEDYDLWLRLSKKYKFAFYDKETAEYRLHSNSITGRNSLFYLKSNLEIFAKHSVHPIAQKQLYNTVILNYENGNKDILKYIDLLESHGHRVKEKVFFKLKIKHSFIKIYFKIINWIIR